MVINGECLQKTIPMNTCVIKKISQIFRTTDMKRISDAWPLYSGHWVLASLRRATFGLSPSVVSSGSNDSSRRQPSRSEKQEARGLKLKLKPCFLNYLQNATLNVSVKRFANHSTVNPVYQRYKIIDRHSDRFLDSPAVGGEKCAL